MKKTPTRLHNTMPPVPVRVRYYGRRYDYASYQQDWFERVKTHPRTVIVCYRGGRKTFTFGSIAAWFMLKFPGYLVSYLPGGKGDFAEIVRYFKGIIPGRSKGRLWSNTLMQLRNKSRLRCLTPTEKGVEGARCNMLMVDEGQLLPEEIHDMAFPQLVPYDYNGIHIGIKEVITGTSKYPSFLNDVYNSAVEKKTINGVIVDVYQGLAEGTINQEEVDIIKDSISNEAWREFYECEWVRKAEYVFQPIIEPVNILQSPVYAGVDFNLSPGHCWVKVVKQGGIYKAFSEGVSTTLPFLKNKLSGCEKVVLESNGFNAGFALEFPKYIGDTRSIRNDWGGNHKAEQIEMVKILNDKQLLVIDPACEKLLYALDHLVFNVEGKIDKNKSKEVHYFDSWIHALVSASSGNSTRLFKINRRSAL